MVDYWSGIKNDLQFPKNVNFEYKTDTDLFEFVMVSDTYNIKQHNNLHKKIPHQHHLQLTLTSLGKFTKHMQWHQP